MIANKLFEAAKNGNTPAMIFFLKVQGGWKEKQEIAVADETPVQVVFKYDLKD